MAGQTLQLVEFIAPSVDVPGGQLKQPEPRLGANLFFPQTMQWFGVPSLLPDPRGHGKHAVPIRENLFGLQSVHALAPPAELLPALHARHGPPATEYVYFGQPTHAGSADDLLVPVGQALQRSVASPVPVANLLRGQLWHGCPGRSVYLFAGQGMQGPPAAEK